MKTKKPAAGGRTHRFPRGLPRLRPIRVVLYLLFAAAAASSQGEEPPEPVAGARCRTHTIVMSNRAPFYSSSALTVEAGDTVRWITTPLSDPHTVEDGGGAFRSPEVAPGEEWLHRFHDPGKYEYGCRLHPWMRATVLVRPKRLAVEEIAAAGTLAGATRLKPPRGVAEPGVALAAGEAPDLPAGARIVSSAVAPSGDVWLADAGRNKILRLGQNGWILEHSLPLGANPLHLLAVGPRGEVWFTRATGDRIGRLQEGRVEEFLLSGHRGQPTSIAVDAKGDLWLAWSREAEVGRVATEALRAPSAVRGGAPVRCEPAPQQTPAAKSAVQGGSEAGAEEDRNHGHGE